MSGGALPGQRYPPTDVRGCQSRRHRRPRSRMGTCRSSCSRASDLEYYDGWRKKRQPSRGPRRHAAVVMDRALVHRSARRRTKLWVCDRGCCSIRWKLDYAEFQSYTKYAEISPYVVEQENHAGCKCVICRGLSDKFVQCRVDSHQSRLGLTTAPPSETDDDDDDHRQSEIQHATPVRQRSLPPRVG